MARPNFIVIFCLLAACFLASANILYAQLHITNGHLYGLTVSSIDPCTGTTLSPAQTWGASAIGQACVGGAIYAGTGYASPLNPSLRYMVTPSGCTDETCTGAGSIDSVQLAWATGTYAGNSTNATDMNNGQNDTGVLSNLLQTGGNTTPAAAFCSNMHYGGYHDWFLPSENELGWVLYLNSTQYGGNLGGFKSSNYWSSTEGSAPKAEFQSFLGGYGASSKAAGSLHVRCVRVY